MDVDRPLSSDGRLQQLGVASTAIITQEEDAATAPPDQEECDGSGPEVRESNANADAPYGIVPSFTAQGISILSDDMRDFTACKSTLKYVAAPSAAVGIGQDTNGRKRVLHNTSCERSSQSVPPEKRDSLSNETIHDDTAVKGFVMHEAIASAARKKPPWVLKPERKKAAKRNEKTSEEREESLDTEAYCRRMWQGQSNILVVVRVRPLLNRDEGEHIVKVLEHKVVVVLDPGRADETKNILRAHRSREKRYAFDYVFDEHQEQQMVYNRTTKFLIQGVLDGFNATVFAYGQTGAGKTYTMIGTRERPGIMVQTMRDLFRHSERVKQEHRMQIKVTVSFLEVYNENIRDLLSNDYGDSAVNKEAPEFLDLREDPIKGPVVAGITEVEASTPEDVMALLQRGNARRSQHATAANENSSRSHAVLQIIVETRESAEGTAAQINIGKLSLVDLAGSERAANTKNRGDRLKEGANINRSLLTLGNCINALGEKASRGQFVPYRDSKLTRLLKDSLGGNCRTVMIANISAASVSFEETLNTLKYANRAKNIKTNVQRNVLEVNHHISEYVRLIQNLRSEVTVLKQQLANSSSLSNLQNMPASNNQLPAALSVSSNIGGSAPEDTLKPSPYSMGFQTPSTDKAVLKEMKAWMQENFRERMQLRRTLIELEDQNVQNSIEIGKRQILVANWNASRTHTPKGFTQEQTDADQVAALVENSPADVRTAYSECEQLRKAIDKNNATKKSISKRLRENERQAEQFHKDLRENRRVTGEERRELLELMYRTGNLELGNMQLEQAQVIHDSVVRGKDLTIQKLQLQVLMRDKVIASQREVLKSHNIDCNVGNVALLLMEDRAISQNFDTLCAMTPATTPVTTERQSTSHSSAAAFSGGSPSRVVLVRERRTNVNSRSEGADSSDHVRDSETIRRGPSSTDASHISNTNLRSISGTSGYDSPSGLYNVERANARREWRQPSGDPPDNAMAHGRRVAELGISGQAAFQGQTSARAASGPTSTADGDGLSQAEDDASHFKSHRDEHLNSPLSNLAQKEIRRRRPRMDQSSFPRDGNGVFGGCVLGTHVSALGHAAGQKNGDSAESDVESSNQQVQFTADVPSVVSSIRAPRARRKRSHLNSKNGDRQGRRRQPLGYKTQSVLEANGANIAGSGAVQGPYSLVGRQALAIGPGYFHFENSEASSTNALGGIRRIKRRSFATKSFISSGASSKSNMENSVFCSRDSKVHPCTDSVGDTLELPRRGTSGTGPSDGTSAQQADDPTSLGPELEIQGVQQASFRSHVPPKSVGIGSLRSKLAQRSNTQCPSGDGREPCQSGTDSSLLDAPGDRAPSRVLVDKTVEKGVYESIAPEEGPGRDSIDALITAAAPAGGLVAL